MEPGAYQRLTDRLRERLAGDTRVVGLVALGSMSGEPPLADEHSDHDFFVVTHPGAQEAMRTDLSWLPDATQLVFSFRETAHGVKALYDSGHLLEFAVFDLDELNLARVNRYGVLLDRGGVEARMRGLRERTSSEVAARRPDARWLSGQFLTAVLVGAGRYRRGEKLAGRARVQDATRDLLQLLALALPALAGNSLDSLDPMRRVEQVYPEIAGQLDAALSLPPPQAALLLLALARRELTGVLPEFPDSAAEVIARALPR